MSISKSSNVSIGGRAALTSVSGNQMVTTIHGNVIHIQKGRTEKDPIYDEFTHVKTGDIITIKEVALGSLRRSKLFHRICAPTPSRARHITLLSHEETTFTAFEYDTHSEWEADFRRFAYNRTENSVWLFGYNKFAVPKLIFHRELIPLGHILSQSQSLWREIYAMSLAEAIIDFPSDPSKLWLDAKSGRICGGPAGPDYSPRGWAGGLVESSLPHTIEMFEEETCIRFYSRRFDRKVDLDILWWGYCWETERYLDVVLPEIFRHEIAEEPIPWTSEYPYLKPLWLKLPSHLPLDDIGHLRFDTVYSPELKPLAKLKFRDWKAWSGRIQVKQIGEMTRISLDAARMMELRKEYLWCLSGYAREWLTQATRVYNAHQPTSYSQDELLTIAPKYSYQFRVTARQDFHPSIFFNLCDNMAVEYPLVYCFLLPPPMTISEYIMWRKGLWRTHFWSFDEDGHSEIPDEECARLDLPICVLHQLHAKLELFSWPQHIYDSLNKYQIARGFDPNTSDWAKWLGLSECEIIGGREKDEALVRIQEPDIEDFGDDDTKKNGARPPSLSVIDIESSSEDEEVSPRALPVINIESSESSADENDHDHSSSSRSASEDDGGLDGISQGSTESKDERIRSLNTRTLSREIKKNDNQKPYLKTKTPVRQWSLAATPVKPKPGYVYSKSAQPRTLQATLDRSSMMVFEHAIFDNMFPTYNDPGEFMKPYFIAAAKDTGDAKSVHKTTKKEAKEILDRFKLDDTFVESFASMTMDRFLEFRAESKTIAEDIVSAQIGLSGLASSAVRALVRQELKDDLFTYGRKKSGAKLASAPYLHPSIKEHLREWLFRSKGSTAVGWKVLPKFVPEDGNAAPRFTIPVVAASAATIESVLHDMSSGMHQRTEFDAEVVAESYARHVSILNEILEDAPDGFHRIMTELYSFATKNNEIKKPKKRWDFDDVDEDEEVKVVI